MNHTQTLQTLLKQCFLLPPDQERRILETWNSLPEEVRGEINKALLGMVAKQDEMLTKMVIADPAFPQKLEGFLDRQMAAAKASDTTKRASALSHIEQQFDA
jgi:hypothetical protein